MDSSFIWQTTDQIVKRQFDLHFTDTQGIKI